MEYAVKIDPYSELLPGTTRDMARKRGCKKRDTETSVTVLHLSGVAFLMHDCKFTDDQKRATWRRVLDSKVDAHVRGRTPLTLSVCFDATTLPAAEEWVRSFGRVPVAYKNVRTTTPVVILNTLVRPCYLVVESWPGTPPIQFSLGHTNPGILAPGACAQWTCCLLLFVCVLAGWAATHAVYNH